MKRPKLAPSLDDLIASIEPETLKKALSHKDIIESVVKGKYLHWTELKYRTPPIGLNHETWWFRIKLARNQSIRRIPLFEDTKGGRFYFGMPDLVLEMLHKIDSKATGRVAISDQVEDPDTRDRYIVNSLIEESIKSSQLEGASTSRKVASNMLRSGRKAKNKHEQMIINNYVAMKFISSVKNEKLTPDLVLGLHKIVTEDTLVNPEAAGKFQTPDDERVSVFDDKTGKQLHSPPPADQLPGRLDKLCNFANEEHTDSKFIHPIIKAIILHFWMGYDHPFEDGNGRLARVLFYWAVLNQNYWLFEFISISRNFKKAPAKYGYAYLFTETDSNDLTYFIIYHLKVILSSIDDLESYLKAKIKEVKALEAKLRNASDFNYRQLALLGHALRSPNSLYTIKSHQRSHNIAYATARADLLNLEVYGLLNRSPIKSKAMEFFAVDDLNERVDELSASVSTAPKLHQ